MPLNCSMLLNPTYVPNEAATMIVLWGCATFSRKKTAEVLNVLDCVFDRPAIVFVSGSRQGETLREQRIFQCCTRSDVGIAVVDFAGVIGLVAITMSKDEQGAIPRFRHTYAIRRAVNLTGQIEWCSLAGRSAINQ